MNGEKEVFTISVFTQNHIGLLARIANHFAKRHINIKSLTVSETEITGISRFTVVIDDNEKRVRLITEQLERQVEVFRAYYHREDEIIFQEIALYKIPATTLQEGMEIANVVREGRHARILSLEEDALIVMKTGAPQETKALFQQLKPFGITEFVRSGRIALLRSGISESIARMFDDGDQIEKEGMIEE